jgi:hypothetical protein
VRVGTGSVAIDHLVKFAAERIRHIRVDGIKIIIHDSDDDAGIATRIIPGVRSADKLKMVRRIAPAGRVVIIIGIGNPQLRLPVLAHIIIFDGVPLVRQVRQRSIVGLEQVDVAQEGRIRARVYRPEAIDRAGRGQRIEMGYAERQCRAATRDARCKGRYGSRIADGDGIAAGLRLRAQAAQSAMMHR